MKAINFYLEHIPRITAILYYLKIYSNQWKSLSQLKKIQLKKLQKLIRYSKKHIPYYRDLMEKVSFKSKLKHTLKEIQTLPIMSKRDLHQNFNNLLSKQINPSLCLRKHTSGSTGEPTTMLYDHHYQRLNHSLSIRQYLAIGIRPYHKHVTIVDDLYIPNLDTFLKRLYYSPVNQISVFEDPSVIAQKLHHLQPEVLHGPPSVLEATAHYAKENRITDIKPKLILCSNEVLDPEARKIIEDVFQAKIFEWYGSVEIPHVAWECKYHNGLHIEMDNVILEIINDGKNCAPLEIGQIIITALNNKVLPLLRYNTGDLGTYSDEACPCGRKSILLKRIYGRAFDLIHLPNGNTTHPWIITDALKPNPAIRQFQIIQEKEDFFVIKIVENKTCSDSLDKFAIKNTCQNILGKDISFKIHSVSKINRGTDRKYRTVISKVKT